MSANLHEVMSAMRAAGVPDSQIVDAMLRLTAEEAAQAALDVPWSALRQQAFQRDGHVCTYCGCSDGPMHVDHIIPRSRGGRNRLENVTVACAPCNLSKKDKTPEEWGRA